ncbi:MAG: ferritin family protein [Gammaproteobacteria bacterium]|nr:ferritin family protein [Gammaproteobacteria bacterium]
MLPTNVKTTGDLMSIALQAEREAIRRYSQLAECMHKGRNESAAGLFERMVLEEQQHEQLLLKWIKQEEIELNPDVMPVSWKDPHVSEIYNDEARDPLYSSAYKALAFAVHNEEIAFRFYTHVAAESDNQSVRHHAEILAREELGHAALLRAERRLAYRAEREQNTSVPVLDSKAIHNETDLLTAAVYIDHYLASQINLINTHYPEIDELAKQTQQQIMLNEQALKDKEPAGEDLQNNLAQLKQYNVAEASKLSDPDSGLQRIWACCDRSFAFYDRLVEEATDETLMLGAQKLSSSALDRIGVLKQALSKS